ncbi:protein deltex-like [Pecten maximus]|uniref:protein deltex-like n=1 Tax=Pecten maximus TaxID=6579 RepID=UPI00145917CE|nr:protein deltex-like [Pecten maximus]
MGNKESRGGQQEIEKEIAIHLFSEELLSNQVDGIVCFTDRKWSTETIACHLLAKHGGNHYTSERHAIKHDNKDCESGNVFVGAGGMLPCKKVLFCVVAENELTEESDNYDHNEVTMVTNMLDKASREEFFSLAVIIDGSDVSPNPTCLIPLIYCKFLLLSSSLQEIHLVSLDESLIDVMQKVLRESHELPVQEAVLGDQSPKNGLTSENSSAMSVQKTPMEENPSVSDKTSTVQPESNSTQPETSEKSYLNNSLSEDEDTIDEGYVNNIRGINDMKIQSKNEDLSVQTDDSELGAVGGSSPPRNTVVFKQMSYDDDEDEDDINFKKTMYKRGDSTKSTVSLEDQLDFVNNFGAKKVERSISDNNHRSPEKGFVCSICRDEKGPMEQTKLEKCGHIFCKDCIGRHLQVHGTCAVCKFRYSNPEGNQPDGIMSYYTTPEINVAGYETVGTIVVEYDIPDGIQTDRHPNPGTSYKGLHRSAFLPDNPDGNRILAMLLKAFAKKLIFTVGTSITTGRDNVTTWNDIHHKTNIKGGPQRFGYPDPTYLRRVYDELIAKGITEDD